MERVPNCPGWFVAIVPALLQFPVPIALQKGCSLAFYNELALSLSQAPIQSNRRVRALRLPKVPVRGSTLGHAATLPCTRSIL
jgi:hypothetical protein